MGFPRKKTYGVYKTVECPFCSRLATQKNEQGIEVCYQHTKSVVEEIKCTCGRWLEPRSGKFGRYFNCLNCGNMNYEKAMQIKEMTMTRRAEEKDIGKVALKPAAPSRILPSKEEKKEIVITSRDVDYFD